VFSIPYRQRKNLVKKSDKEKAEQQQKATNREFPIKINLINIYQYPKTSGLHKNVDVVAIWLFLEQVLFL
jgi:hypothetical protein